MTNIATAGVPGQDTSGERDLLLTALRAASARLRLACVEVDSIGVALRQKAINCEQAMQWARDEGLISWIRLGPEAQS
jgi:hypothetical protein